MRVATRTKLRRSGTFVECGRALRFNETYRSSGANRADDCRFYKHAAPPELVRCGNGFGSFQWRAVRQRFWDFRELFNGLEELSEILVHVAGQTIGHITGEVGIF